VVEAAAARAALPGRFERLDVSGCEVILDVAHNPHGARFLARQLASLPPAPTAAVAGFLKDKDVGGIVGALEDHIQDWTFVGTEGERGQSGADSLRQCAINSQHSSEYTAGQALGRLVAGRKFERIVVLGSFDVVGAARQHLLSEHPPRASTG
jgi:dihydrofolate synthase/folylpolyglutamate synthase